MVIKSDRRWLFLVLLGGALSLGACAGQHDVTGASSASKPVAGYQRLGTEKETLEERVNRLEQDLAELRIDYSVVRPAMEKLVFSENSLDRRLNRIESAFGPATASLGLEGDTARAPSPAKASQSSPETAAMPRMDPVRDEMKAPVTAAAGFGIHLASYRGKAAAMEGWSKLQQSYKSTLASYRPIIHRFDAGKDGTYQRLLAGPLSTQAAAESLCASLKKQGAWCQVLALNPSSQ